MKSFKYIVGSLILGLFLMSSCTKEETVKYDIPVKTTDGQCLFQGTVKYIDYGVGTTAIVAPGATIKISTDLVNKTYTQFWKADSVGNFSVKGLPVGNYYMAAEYTDKVGYTYSTEGFTVNVKNTVNPITLNFVCK